MILTCPDCQRIHELSDCEYRSMLEQGGLLACARNHPVTVLGSEGGGSLSEDERSLFEAGGLSVAGLTRSAHIHVIA